jgi:hypothetical protein
LRMGSVKRRRLGHYNPVRARTPGHRTAPEPQRVHTQRWSCSNGEGRRKASANRGSPERMRRTPLKIMEGQGKAMGQAERHLCLKPYRGKPDVRNFRGGAGNGRDGSLEGDTRPKRGETVWPHKVWTRTAPVLYSTVIMNNRKDDAVAMVEVNTGTTDRARERPLPRGQRSWHV